MRKWLKKIHYQFMISQVFFFTLFFFGPCIFMMLQHLFIMRNIELSDSEGKCANKKLIFKNIFLKKIIWFHEFFCLKKYSDLHWLFIWRGGSRRWIFTYVWWCRWIYYCGMYVDFNFDIIKNLKFVCLHLFPGSFS